MCRSSRDPDHTTRHATARSHSHEAHVLSGGSIRLTVDPRSVNYSVCRRTDVRRRLSRRRSGRAFHRLLQRLRRLPVGVQAHDRQVDALQRGLLGLGKWPRASTAGRIRALMFWFALVAVLVVELQGHRGLKGLPDAAGRCGCRPSCRRAAFTCCATASDMPPGRTGRRSPGPQAGLHRARQPRWTGLQSSPAGGRTLVESEITRSSRLVSRRCRLATIRGSNDASRSLGTEISAGPASGSTVLDRRPFWELPLRPLEELRLSYLRESQCFFGAAESHEDFRFLKMDPSVDAFATSGWLSAVSTCWSASLGDRFERS